MGYFEELYKTKIVADLKNKFGIKNPHCVPKISKIVVSAGFGTDEEIHRRLHYCEGYRGAQAHRQHRAEKIDNLLPPFTSPLTPKKPNESR